MRNLLRFALFAVLAIACANNVYCQANDPEFIPKGEYAVYNSGKSTSIVYNNVIYSANAMEMRDNWTLEGFTASDSSLSTGVYDNGTVYKAVSPVMEIPYGQHCYLKLDSKLHSESHFDNARVEVMLKNGERHLVYTASGVKNRYDEFIDVHWFSGYRVQFVFTFECDSTFNGEGWDIYEMALCNSVAAPKKKKGLMKTPNGNVPVADADSITMLLKDSVAKLNLYGVTWDDTEKTKGSVSFSLTDKNGNYIDLFSLSSPNNQNSTHVEIRDTVKADSVITDAIRLIVNGKEITDCKAIKQDREHQKLDIIYAVDCSASMEKYQNQLKISIDSLNSLLKNRYDLRSAVLFFRWNRPENWELHDFTYDYKFNNTYKNDGATTYCNSVLKYLSKVNLSYNDQSQKVIVLLGNDDGNEGWVSIDYETSDTLRATTVTQMLREKGFQTYVVYNKPSDFRRITEGTNGKYIMSQKIVNGDTILFNPDSVAITISNSMKYRYFMEFCMPDTATVCQDTALIQLSIDKDKADSINSKVLYMPKLDLTSEWKQYDEGERCYAKKMNGDSLHIGFTVHNPCETDTIRNVMVYYGYNGDTSLSHQNPALMQDDSIWRATIPLCDTVQSVRYKIKAENSWASINYPAVGEKVDNLLKQWFVVRTDCEPMCGSFSLSSNPVTSKSDTLGFNVGYKCDIRFALLDRKGNPIPGLSGRLKKTRTYEAGSYSEPLSKIFPGLFRMGLDPLTPYLLVVSNGNEVFMTYVYISRL